MVLKNPIRFAGRGGPLVQNTKLPIFTSNLSCIGGCSPISVYSIQYNFLSLKAYTQLVLYADVQYIGYGGGAAPAKIVDMGGPAYVYLEPQASPSFAEIPTKAKVADFNAGDVTIQFTYDGNVTFTFQFRDSSNNLIDEVTQKFMEPPKMMAVEPVGAEEGSTFDFKTGAFRFMMTGMDVLNAVGGEAPIFGIDATSNKPVMWAISTAESSNLQMLFQSQVPKQLVVDYLTS